MSRVKRAEKIKQAIRSRTGTIFIIVGLSLALLPFLVNTYNKIYYPPPPIDDGIKEIVSAERSDMPFILPTDENEDAQTSSGLEAQDTEVIYPENILPLESTVLFIPVLDVMTIVTYGVELEDLRTIPGIYPQSGYPDIGNVSIAAHRDAWFRDLDKLEEGDEIRLYYDNKVYVYAVESVFITHSRDWSVIDPADEPALTLTTCHPPGLGAAPYRLIARAYLTDIIENLG